jgi:chitinase
MSRFLICFIVLVALSSVAGAASPLRRLAPVATVSVAAPDAAPFFFPYKDSDSALNWNTNELGTAVSGNRINLIDDMRSNSANAVTLAFATGECGAEGWGEVSNAQLAGANAAGLHAAGIMFKLSTGGADGSFTCTSQTGFDQFISPWLGSSLAGIDFDIESSMSAAALDALIARVNEARSKYPQLSFSFTIATLAQSPPGVHVATPFSGSNKAPDPLDSNGDAVLQAIIRGMGWQQGQPNTWPKGVYVNIMTMDYGDSASADLCVVSAAGNTCDMSESSIQAAYNLRDYWGVPLSAVELTPMIGDNDVATEMFSLQNADSMTRQAKQLGMAGVHYWSYDRDTPCKGGQLSASGSCNSAPNAQPHSFLQQFLHSSQQKTIMLSEV